MNCGACGSPLESDARFCGVCGTPVLQAPVTAPTSPGPPPLPDMARAAAPAQGASRSSASTVLLVLGIVVAVLVGMAGLGFAGYALVKQVVGPKGPGAPQEVRSTGSVAESSTPAPDTAEDTTPAADETSPAVTAPPTVPAALLSPAGTVLNLKDKPSAPNMAALRQRLLDGARKRLKTNSRFFVNQLWVDGEWAIGEIGAEKRGHRIWVVWRGNPSNVVFVRDWGVTDEQVLRAKVGELPPELLARIDWTKRWPKEFKFVR